MAGAPRSWRKLNKKEKIVVGNEASKNQIKFLFPSLSRDLLPIFEKIFKDENLFVLQYTVCTINFMDPVSE